MWLTKLKQLGGLCEVLQLVNNSFPLPLLPLHHSPPSPVSLFQIKNVVITEQMNLLTPKLDLRDDDISDVRQCFTHVHEHVLIQIFLRL